MKPKVAIIGGQGLMGRWFQNFFKSQGLTVLVADLDTPQTAREVAPLADVVVVSVPIPQVAQVVREVAPYLRPDAALMDLTSVKTEPVAAMLAHFTGEVVGTHPLFGPREENIKGRTVVLCPGRGERWLQWLERLLLEAGAHVQIITPEEHDRLMALIQGLAHFLLIALGVTVRRMEIDLKELENFATPTFRNLHYLIWHMLSQDVALYACIQLQNQANLPVLKTFEEAAQEVLSLVQGRDIKGLMNLLMEVRQYYLAALGEEVHF
jgi:prephenate dehydrogenase